MKQKPDLCEFKASQSHIVRACFNPPQKKTPKNKQAKRKELREESPGSRRL